MSIKQMIADFDAGKQVEIRPLTDKEIEEALLSKEDRRDFNDLDCGDCQFYNWDKCDCKLGIHQRCPCPNWKESELYQQRGELCLNSL